MNIFRRNIKKNPAQASLSLDNRFSVDSYLSFINYQLISLQLHVDLHFASRL